MKERARFSSAVFAFFALPGTIGFLVPWTLRPIRAHVHPAGLAILAAGVIGLLWCVRDFYVAGRGTLAPWSPPRHLVTVGLYRVSRNPMYIAVLTVLCGWATTFTSRALWIYEPDPEEILARLARTHGAEWVTYRAHVPRWFGRASLHPLDKSIISRASTDDSNQ